MRKPQHVKRLLGPHFVRRISSSAKSLAAMMAFLPATIYFVAATSVFGAEPGRETLPGHVPAAVAALASTGRLPATHQLSLAIGLPLRNQAALDELLGQLYDPRSTNFHQYLTPAEFAARFGPAEQDYQAAIQFAEANGLTVAGTHPNRVVLDVSGSAADVERAFHIILRTWRHPAEARDFFAPDTEPSVPTNVSVVTIEGLSDFSPPRPLARKVDALKVRPLSFNGSGPNGEYAGNDFRNAYAPGTTLNGAGQAVGLLEFSDYFPADITRYETTIGLTNPVPVNKVVIGHPGPTTANNAEVALDIEVAIAMAPGLSQVIVYEIKSSPSSILSRMANDNLAKQLSSSWSWSGGPSTTIDAIFKQMAAQGQSFFQASGDSDAYTGSQTLDNSSQTTAPVDSTNLTAVGGTTLMMDGAGVSWASEMVWNYNTNANPIPNEGSGGGISVYYAIPYWQTNVSMANNAGSTTHRNVPDVALTADNIFVSFNNGDASGTYYFMGTSAAAPLWAGFCALVNQQSVATSGTTVGFLNPALYAIARGSNYTSCFHDITTGNNIGTNTPGLYNAVTNYDLATGLGTPNGTNLINALAPSVLPYIITQPSGQTVTNGANVTLSATIGGQSPLNYRWLFNGTNLPAGGNLSGTTSNVLSITSATPNNSGSYRLVATNTFGSVTSSIAVLTVGFAPAFTAQPTNLAVLSGGNAVFSATAGGSAPLAYQWRQNGTSLVNGAGISGATSNVLTLTAVTTGNSGSYSLAVTNLFGAATSSVVVLTVNLISPSLALSSSVDPSGYRGSLNFTAAVAPTNAGGSVQFFTNGAAFDLQTLAAGRAVSTNLSSLPRGTNLITAIYSGDANNLPATNTLAQVVTNHPPSATAAFYTRAAGYPLSIVLTNLAAGWSDADGDSLALAAVGLSTNGVTLTNNGLALVYFNSNNVADRFACTISDGWGGTNFQAVDIAIAFSGIAGEAANPDGSFTLNLAVVGGYTCVLETTTNLISSVNWLPVATNTSGTNGVWQFNDTQAANFPQRFYRLKLLP